VLIMDFQVFQRQTPPEPIGKVGFEKDEDGFFRPLIVNERSVFGKNNTDIFPNLGKVIVWGKKRSFTSEISL
jgi:hypothetical protein